MVGVMRVYGALMQIPGVDAPNLTLQQQLSTNWDGMGFMRWPLAFCVILGAIVITWKFFDLLVKSSRTWKILGEVDELGAVEARLVGEEPQVPRLLRHALEPLLQAALVLGSNEAQPHPGPRGQREVLAVVGVESEGGPHEP